MFGKKTLFPADNGGAPQPKSFVETIISTTPVLLTVVATLLAGLSSSEMTQAQYYRSLAAQYQSKAGDQWGFFQAKRIRGSSLEQTAELLRPSGEPLAQSLPALAGRLQKQIHGAEQQTERLVKLLAAGSVTVVEYVPSRQSLQQEAEQLLRTLRDKAKKGLALQESIAQRLQAPEMKRILAYLGTDAIPVSASDSDDRSPAVRRACQCVRERKPDPEITAVLRDLPQDQLAAAIAGAESHAGSFEKQVQPATRAIDDLGKLVNELCTLAHAAHRAVQDAFESAELAGKNEDPLGQSAARLLRTTVPASTAADAVQADFKAAYHAFKARCYEHEARQNQSVAELYELQVRVHSVASERHRQRSKHFFYGMLGAQAGVTIASLALAVRRKSVLWSVATATGLGAIFFSGYVYVCM